MKIRSVLASGMLILRRPSMKLMSPGSLPSPNFESHGTAVISTIRTIKIVKIQRMSAF